MIIQQARGWHPIIVLEHEWLLNGKSFIVFANGKDKKGQKIRKKGEKVENSGSKNGDASTRDYDPLVTRRRGASLASKRSFTLVANVKRFKELELWAVEWP